MATDRSGNSCWCWRRARHIQSRIWHTPTVAANTVWAVLSRLGHARGRYRTAPDLRWRGSARSATSDQLSPPRWLARDVPESARTRLRMPSEWPSRQIRRSTPPSTLKVTSRVTDRVRWRLDVSESVGRCGLRRDAAKVEQLLVCAQTDERRRIRRPRSSCSPSSRARSLECPGDPARHRCPSCC